MLAAVARSWFMLGDEVSWAVIGEQRARLAWAVRAQLLPSDRTAAADQA